MAGWRFLLPPSLLTPVIWAVESHTVKSSAAANSKTYENHKFKQALENLEPDYVNSRQTSVFAGNLFEIRR